MRNKNKYKLKFYKINEKLEIFLITSAGNSLLNSNK